MYVVAWPLDLSVEDNEQSSDARFCVSSAGLSGSSEDTTKSIVQVGRSLWQIDKLAPSNEDPKPDGTQRAGICGHMRLKGSSLDAGIFVLFQTHGTSYPTASIHSISNSCVFEMFHTVEASAWMNE